MNEPVMFVTSRFSKILKKYWTWKIPDDNRVYRIPMRTEGVSISRVFVVGEFKHGVGL